MTIWQNVLVRRAATATIVLGAVLFLYSQFTRGREKRDGQSRANWVGATGVFLVVLGGCAWFMIVGATIKSMKQPGQEETPSDGSSAGDVTTPTTTPPGESSSGDDSATASPPPQQPQQPQPPQPPQQQPSES